jgi:hypothetical protein
VKFGKIIMNQPLEQLETVGMSRIMSQDFVANRSSRNHDTCFCQILENTDSNAQISSIKTSTLESSTFGFTTTLFTHESQTCVPNLGLYVPFSILAIIGLVAALDATSISPALPVRPL